MAAKMQLVGEKAQKFPCFADTYSRKPVTDVFTKDTDMDKRGMTRTVPMKVLLLAVGRTGTACRSFFLFFFFYETKKLQLTNTVV